MFMLLRPVVLLLGSGLLWVTPLVAAQSPAATPDSDTSEPAPSAASKTAPSAASETAAPGPRDWPSFRNGNAQRGLAGSDLPEALELKWQVESPDGFVATAAIVGDRVYAGTLSGDFLCLDLETGKEIWKTRSIDNPNPNKFAPGFKAAPRVTADSVYVGDEDGVLHAFERATGALRWRLQTDAEIAGCPAVVDDRLIIGSHDSFLYCLKQADGTLVWKFQTNDRINCSPAISGSSTFVTGCDEHLRVINIETGEQTADIPLGSYLIASPALVGEMLYVGTYASEVLAVNWKEEKFVWRYRDPRREFPYHASAAVTEELVIVGGQDKQLHCINRQSGEKVWVFPTRAQVNSSPVVVGDRVVFGSNDGNIYIVSLKDGAERWRFRAGSDVTASPAVGVGRLVIGAEGRNGALYCFGAAQ